MPSYSLDFFENSFSWNNDYKILVLEIKTVHDNTHLDILFIMIFERSHNIEMQ